MSSTLTVRSLIVAACWVLGIGLAVLDVCIEAPLAALSIAAVGAGATIYFAGRLDKLSTDWVEAYEAGREVTRIRQSR